MKPTPEQKPAILSPAPVIGLCGPGGTGKTETLSFMVDTRLNHHPRVLVLAYTNKAVLNMRERLAQNGIAVDEVPIQVCTFHSWALSQVRNPDHSLGYQQPLELIPGINEATIEEQAGKGITKKELAFLNHVYAQHLRRAVSLKSACKHLKASPAQRKILNAVRAHALTTGHIDFDDIPHILYRACQDSDYATHLAEAFPCILADEFQDLTGVQWKTLKILIEHGTHFIGAGDPYQTLFRFAGASLRRFPQLWAMPNCESFTLTKNQRLTKQVLSLSNEVRKQIRDRLPGYPLLPQSSRTPGPKPKVVVNPYRSMHIRGVIDRIQFHLNDGMSLKNMVVLVRQDRDASSLIKKLNLEQWPYVSYLKEQSVTPSINLVKAVLKIRYGTAGKKAWLSVLKDMPGVGKATIERVLNLIDENRWTAENISCEGKRVRDVFQKFTDASNAINLAGDDLTKALNVVLDFIRTIQNAPDLDIDPNIENLFKQAKVSNVLGELLGRNSFGHFESHGIPDTKDYITVANIHKYKGGEAKVVFFLSPFPAFYRSHGTFKNKKKVVEEMMALDTAITRAAEFLYLFFPMNFKAWQNLETQHTPADFIMSTDPRAYDLCTLVEDET